MFKVCFNINLTSARNHCFNVAHKSPLVQRIKPVYKSINTDILVQSIRAPEATCKASALYVKRVVFMLCVKL